MLIPCVGLRSARLASLAGSLAVFFAVFLLASSALAQNDPGTSYRLRVLDPLSQPVRQRLEASFDVVPNAAGGIDVIVLPEEMGAWKRTGIKTRLVSRGRPFRDVPSPGFAPDARYYTPAEIVTKIDGFVSSYPKLAKKIDLSLLIGAAKTHDGRSIYALKVSDNVGNDEDEPAILLAAQHHARELATPVVVFAAIDRILKGYATNAKLKALVDGHELYFVPCVNPDGTNYVWTKDNFWRKNRRANGGSSFGVDNNRNYPFLFGRCGASSRTTSQIYKGPSAGSEPENKTMMAAQRLWRPEIYLDFHSTGREVLFTYAPCATVNSTIRTLLNRYVSSLRAPMAYATRSPSASGEAPEFHWADGGSMSFLVETLARTSGFQPSYTVAVAEAARVWPGVEKALTTWRPSVRGHVKSIFKDRPIAATIRYTPNRFTHGEKSGSRARDGRYGLWLPIGTHSVTWSAAGFRSVTKSIRVTAYDSPTTVEVVMIPNMATPSIAKSGTDRIGTTTSLTYTSTGDANETYWIVLAAGTNPGIDIGAGRVIPLNADAVFFASLRPGVLLTNGTGTLSASGKATASFAIPNIPAFIGLTVYAGGITQNNAYLNFVKNYSGAVAITMKS
jgi:Zinc carboxypeptidase